MVEEEEVEEVANVMIGNEIKDGQETREEVQSSNVNEEDADRVIAKMLLMLLRTRRIRIPIWMRQRSRRHL